MEPSPLPQSLSVLSLVKRLAGHRWISAYERLLDISGEHRDGTLPRNPETHLLDVISELLILGDPTNAANLERITSFLSTNTDYSDCLLVLLLCATKTRQRPKKEPSFPVAQVIDSPVSLLHDTPIHPFTNEYAAEPNEPLNLSFTKPQPDSDNSNSAYCIADASRCEHDSYNLWLRSNLETAATNDESVSQSQHQYQRSPVLSPENNSPTDPESPAAEPHLAPDYRDPKIEASSKHNREPDISKPFLHDVCHLCLTGPDVPQEHSSHVPLLPTSLFEASATPETKPSHQRSSAFAWRRSLVNELKNWSLDLRQRSRRRTALSPSTRAQICGLIYQSIISFGPAYLSKQSSTALKALVSYIALRTDEYLGAILDAAMKPCSDPGALDLLVLDTAETFTVNLREIEGVLEAVEETDGSSESILRALSGQLRRFPCSAWLQGLFTHITGKYEKVLNDWVKEGWCNREESTSVAETTKLGSCLTNTALSLAGSSPETNTIVATQSADALFSKSQALFFRRAGYGRAILRELTSTHSSARSAPCNDFSPGGGDVMKHDGSRLHSSSLLSEASEGNGASPNPAKRAFTSSLESYSDPKSVPDQSLDNYMRFFSLRDKMVPALKSDRNQSDLPDEKNSTAAATSCEYGRVERAVYPTLYAELTVDLFRKEDELVQRKIFDIFVTDLEVFGHLNFIRKFVLLGAGDFANELVEHMNAASSASESGETFLQNRKRAALTFYGSADAGKSQVRSLLYLRRCFRTAAYLFNGDTERFVSRLTLEIPANMDVLNSRKDLWDYQVEFGYNVPDALKLIISEDAMVMYSKIHWFFLRVNRAKMSLRNLFMMTRRRSMLNKLASQNVMQGADVRATLWLFCMDSEQFVNKLGGFFMDQVIGSAWESFQDVWTSCENVWELRDAHERFLEGSIQRCLLDPRQKSVCSVISGGFDIIHKVEKDVMKLQKSNSLVAMKVGNVQDFVSSASASLRRRSLFLADILERLSEAGTWHATTSEVW